MISDMSHHNVTLLCFIVNNGLGSRVLRQARRLGISGGTVLLGHGSVNSQTLDMFSLCDTRKEIVLMIAPKPLAMQALKALVVKFKLDRRDCGIAFAVAVSRLIGKHQNPTEEKALAQLERDRPEEEKEDETMYQAIYTIVDRGRAEQVIEAASHAGAAGGTIINARGSGIHETSRLFAMEIEPEKEMVLILIEKALSQTIVDTIYAELEIEKAGNGIIFVLDVASTYGLVSSEDRLTGSSRSDAT